MDVTHFNLAACNHLLRLRRERRISWRTFVLGTAIVGLAEMDGGAIWPSLGLLSATTGINTRDIRKIVRKLRSVGFSINGVLVEEMR